MLRSTGLRWTPFSDKALSMLGAVIVAAAVADCSSAFGFSSLVGVVGTPKGREGHRNKREHITSTPTVLA